MVFSLVCTWSSDSECGVVGVLVCLFVVGDEMRGFGYFGCFSWSVDVGVYVLAWVVGSPFAFDLMNVAGVGTCLAMT